MLRKEWAFCICDFETTGIDTETDYPIEVGCIYTDCLFSTIGMYQDFIGWPALEANIENNTWPDFAQRAFQVHGIKAENYMKENKNFKVVAKEIYDTNAALLENHKKVILLSDNAQFETAFMKRLFKEAGLDWNFHFCTWDSSLLLEATPIGDPVPDHRALRDCALLQRNIIRALQYVGTYK